MICNIAGKSKFHTFTVKLLLILALDFYIELLPTGSGEAFCGLIVQIIKGRKSVASR